MTRLLLVLILATASQAANPRDYRECRRAGYRQSGCFFYFIAKPAARATLDQWNAPYIAGYWAGYEAATRGARTSYAAPPPLPPYEPAIVEPGPTRRERRRPYSETQTRIGQYIYTTNSEGRQCTSWRQGLDWVTQCY